MPQPTVIMASLDSVLNAVAAQIVSATGIPAYRVLKVARNAEEVPRFTGVQDILLRFQGFVTDPNWRGRHNRRVLQKLHVTIRTRCASDETSQDVQWLADPNLGSTFAWQDIADCLEEFFPYDSKGNMLTWGEGMYLLEGDDGYKRPKDSGWGEVKLVYAVPVALPLTQVGNQSWMNHVG